MTRDRPRSVADRAPMPAYVPPPARRRDGGAPLLAVLVVVLSWFAAVGVAHTVAAVWEAFR